MHHKTTSSTAGAETRRDFLKKTASAAAIVASGSLFKTPVYGQTTAPSTGRVIGANDRIVLGFVGLGGSSRSMEAKGEPSECKVRRRGWGGEQPVDNRRPSRRVWRALWGGLGKLG